MRKTFAVSVDIPEGVSITEMQDYIREAVSDWKGQMDPKSAMFDLDPDKVTVRPVGDQLWRKRLSEKAEKS